MRGPQLPCTNCNRNLVPKRAILGTKLAARGNFGAKKDYSRDQTGRKG